MSQVKMMGSISDNTKSNNQQTEKTNNKDLELP